MPMLSQRLHEMFDAKTEEYFSDALQKYMFDAVVRAHENIKSGSLNLPRSVCDFVHECATYITRDRALQVNALIEAELIQKDLFLVCDEYVQAQSDLLNQDEYYLNAIVQNRHHIFH